MNEIPFEKHGPNIKYDPLDTTDGLIEAIKQNQEASLNDIRNQNRQVFQR